MISDTSVSDGGWGASCYQAMVDAAAEKGWETVYTDNVATSDYATVMTDYAELGYDLIFAPGNQYTDAVKQVAKEYPEIKFALLMVLLRLTISSLSFQMQSRSVTWQVLWQD